MKLEITSNRDFTVDFTVISSDGTTPELLDPTDTATIEIQTAGLGTTSVIPQLPIQIKDINNGLFTTTIDKSLTGLLDSDIGFAEDNYPTQGNYKALLTFTLVSGNRDATMPVYVIEAV